MNIYQAVGKVRTHSFYDSVVKYTGVEGKKLVRAAMIEDISEDSGLGAGFIELVAETAFLGQPFPYKSKTFEGWKQFL